MSSEMRPDFRVGTGYDFHSFEEGQTLVLGGVVIPHDRGLKGHSDADALLHAIMDALLGAAGLKDIGSYFPDSDPKYREISSLLLLEKVYRLVRGKGFSVGNVDLTVIAEETQDLSSHRSHESQCSPHSASQTRPDRYQGHHHGGKGTHRPARGPSCPGRCTPHQGNVKE